jgi:hypothetical protein
VDENAEALYITLAAHQREVPLALFSSPDMVVARPMSIDNGLVNLAAIVSAIIVLIGTIPAILLLTTPRSGGSGDGK